MTAPVKILDSVYRITPSRVNCYLLVDKDLALIDTGMPGEAENIIAAIETLGRSVTDIRYILITHGHLDHIGSLCALKKLSGAQVVAGARDALYIHGKKKTWSMRREGFGGKIFKTVLFFMELFTSNYEPVEVDIACNGDEIINCCGGIQAIATPGHSPGSISYYHKENKLLFVGDSLSGTGGFKLPLRFGCADHQEALRSVEKLTRLTFDSCLLGHGEPVIGNAKEKMQALLQHSS